MDEGMGAVLASLDKQGKVRVILVNRATSARQTRFEVSGSQALPTSLLVFDDPTKPPRSVVSTAVVTVPSGSLLLAEF